MGCAAGLGVQPAQHGEWRGPDPAVLLPGSVAVPVVGVGTVSRSRLVTRLARGEFPVVVVTAPAGYGKTTLLAEWAAGGGQPFAWLTVPGAGIDAAGLVVGLARALGAAGLLPPGGLRALDPEPGELPRLLPRLAGALVSGGGPFVLVVDDAHNVVRPDALAVLAAVADHLPPGSRLVVAGRGEPAFGTSRLCVQRRLSRVGAGDLAMDRREAALLAESAGVTLGGPATEALVEGCEGWAAGLYLAALSLRDSDDPDRAALRFGGDDRLVSDYVMEVLGGLDPATVRFLLETSVLDRMSAGVCDAVRRRHDSAGVLERLRRSELFVVPLDASGGWYRYQRLVAGALRGELRRRLGDREARLNARASAWWERHGDTDAAVRHAHAAGDIGRFATLVWEAAPSLLAGGGTDRLGRWLALPSPREVAGTEPLPLVARWLDVARSGAAGAPPAVDPLPPEGGDPEVTAAALLLRAVRGRRGLAGTGEDSEVAYRLAGPASPWRAYACLLLGASMRLGDRPGEAVRVLEEGYRAAAAGMPAVACLCATELCWAAIERDDWAEAADLAALAVACADRCGSGQGLPAFAAAASAAWVAARRGDTTLAQDHLRAARGAGEPAPYPPAVSVEARVALAHAVALTGDLGAARRLLNGAAAAAARMPDFAPLTRRAGELRSSLDTAGASRTPGPPLTPAELRVLRYLPTHLTFQAIGQALVLSTNTVKTQAIAVYRKLGASSRADAVERARTWGLLPP